MDQGDTVLNQGMAVPSSDRLSLLPDCILEVIMVLLPLHEIVRTSVLSKRWVSLWTQIPKLVFDKSFFKSIKNDKSRIMPIIRNILFRHRQPLHDFTFSLSGVSSIDLNLPVHYRNIYGDEYFKLDGELYNLLSLDEFRLLKHLRLESCLCTFPCGFRGFTMLTNLSFYDVDIDGGELSELVSSCPLLDTLTLDSLTFCYYLDLVAPNLRVFCCEGCFLTLSLEYTPRLEQMTVSFDDSLYDEDEDSEVTEDMVVPFGVISAVTYLMLNGSFLKYMNRGKENKISRCRNDLNHLKVIKLIDVPFEEIEVAQNVLSLIRLSPNLEMILVSACTDQLDFEPAVGVWRGEDLSVVSLNGLRHVCITNITGKQSELLFIKALLAKSPMLEVMTIWLHNELAEEEALRILEEARRFIRASSRVRIKSYRPIPNN